MTGPQCSSALTEFHRFALRLLTSLCVQGAALFAFFIELILLKIVRHLRILKVTFAVVGSLFSSFPSLMTTGLSLLL